MEQEGQVRRDESVVAKMVVGVAMERLASAVAEERSWNPRLERMVAKRECGDGWRDGANAAMEVVEMKTEERRMKNRVAALAIDDDDYDCA